MLGVVCPRRLGVLLALLLCCVRSAGSGEGDLYQTCFFKSLNGRYMVYYKEDRVLVLAMVANGSSGKSSGHET